MTTVHSSIDQHPDILALRARYDRVAESMAAQATFGLTLLAAVYVAMSPWLVGYQASTKLMVNALIMGATIGFLAIDRKSVV